MDAVEEKESTSVKDLTKGPIIKNLLIFFLPIAAGTLFQLLYNTVDAFVVGKFVGTQALAAVGGSASILSSLVIGFCTSLASGAAVVIAQLCGAKDYKSLSSAVKTSFVFCTVLGVAVGALIILFAPQLLTLLKTPEDTFADSLLYARIYFSSSAFLLIYNMGAGILRSVGDSKFPFVCLIVSCLLNIALDFLFVLAFHWNVAGVSWATVIAQVVCAVMITVRLLRTKEPYALRFKEVKFSKKLLKKMMKIGIPSGMQTAMYNLSSTILQIGVNTLGTVVVASWAMSGKIDGVYWSITSAFGIALTTVIGQCYGAHKFSRIRETVKKSMVFFFFATVAISILIMVFARPLLHVLSDDKAVWNTTWKIIVYFVPAYFLWSFIEVYTGVLRGIGDTVVPSAIIAVGICVLRVAWIATAFKIWPTLLCICFSYPISWIITVIVIIIYYYKKEKTVFIKKQEI